MLRNLKRHQIRQPNEVEAEVKLCMVDFQAAGMTVEGVGDAVVVKIVGEDHIEVVHATDFITKAQVSFD